jgi:cysteinyl-tRNA synthetase
MALRIYNSLTRRKEEFVPLHPREVKMYVCGVTPYDLCHIGHARAALAFDVIKRYLEFQSYKVTMVRNFTDIDDKIIARGASLGLSWREVANQFIEEYYKDMKALALGAATIEPKATDHIPDMIAMIKELVSKGYAYTAGGDVYFEVRKLSFYGKLSHRNLGELRSGSRVEIDPRKKDPLDFALWKSSKEGEPSWDSPWGPGRPGWHIECSVMAIKYLGETIDIHGGGADLIFPHHENEIAQSEAFTGKEFARYWVHNGFVNIDAEKMSKSLGNFLTIREVLARYDSDALKLFLLSTHYRVPVDFSDRKLDEAEKALDRAQLTLEKAERIADGKMDSGSSAPSLAEALRKADDSFLEAMNDDFHTPRAIASLFDMIRQLNGCVEKGIRDPLMGTAARRVRELARVMGLMERKRAIHFVGETEFGEISAENYGEARERIESAGKASIPAKVEDVRTLLIWRALARKRGDWHASDEIRDWIRGVGVSVEDTREGFYWKCRTS